MATTTTPSSGWTTEDEFQDLIEGIERSSARAADVLLREYPDLVRALVESVSRRGGVHSLPRDTKDRLLEITRACSE